MRHTIVLLALGALPLGAQAGQEAKQRAAAAVALPTTSAELRIAGVADRAITEMIDVLRRDRVGVGGIGDMLGLEREALRSGGRPDNFGAFVQQARAQGLRGQALAAAIHAEKARRGGNVGVGGPPKGRGGPPAGMGRGGEQRGGEQRGGEQQGGPPTGRAGRGGRGG